MTTVHTLASGSSGNALLLSYGDTHLLVDAGISCRRITASLRELTKEQQRRYGAVYCGICRRIRTQSGNLARLGLSYDMAFLALLLMSLYEPEESPAANVG